MTAATGLAPKGETPHQFEVCIVGSGAGAGPIAYELARAGIDVVVLEKGDWYTEQDFVKDEQLPRHRVFRSRFDEERHVLELPDGEGGWRRETTAQFWGGNIVGGASNFMSGYFHRLKPTDFRLASAYGVIPGSNTVDWPISYEDLEPYYTKVEQLVGVSGRVVQHPHLEPRSTPDFPFAPTVEHPIAARFDNACEALKLNPLPMARAILSRPFNGRMSCEYSGYCGSYGCHSGAKGSSRAALLNHAVASGHCRIIPRAKVYRLNTDSKGRVSSADYFDAKGESRRIQAKVFVVACYAIESARLLLASTGEKHPKGIGNRHGQVGKNLHCCAGGTGHGVFKLDKLSAETVRGLKQRGPFFNRALQDWYVIDDKAAFDKPVKGGTLDFVFDPPSPTSEANALKWQEGNLLWGTPLKQKLKAHFTQSRDFKFEVFCDWLTHDECFVSLDDEEKDKWGQPVAKVRAGFHPHDLKIAQYLVDRGVEVMQAMGADEVWGNVFSDPTANLVAGGCRFGVDPRTSVLDPDCRVHDCDNLYVTDGAFMPNGGSVTPTFTIYANAFRVADKLLGRLKQA